jgi:hypothetical protein
MWEANLLFFDSCIIINSAFCQLAHQISPSLAQDNLYYERSCNAKHFNETGHTVYTHSFVDSIDFSA